MGKAINKYSSIPIQFEHVENVLDNRFMKVKVWIAHTGENRNNSIFSKEVLTSMIPSLANIPILGYIAVNSDGEEDFRGHNEKLVVEDGKLKLKYLGHAYGVIPEDNNAHFESRYGEDGVEREYLVCDGLIWRKFDEVEKIFDRDNGFKSQSMELEPSSIKGYINDEGLFVFTQAKFEGACLLGEDVTPAMISSTVEKFSVDKIQEDLKEMLAEFNTYFSTTIKKGEGEVAESDLEKVVEPEEGAITEPAQDDSNFQAEQTPEQAQEQDAEPVIESGEPNEFTDSAKEEDEPEQTPDTFTVKFELSHEDIRTKLYEAFNAHEAFKDSYVYISSVFDNYAIAEVENYEAHKTQFFKVNYVKHENAVSLGDYEEVFPMFLNATEKAHIDSLRSNFEALEKEVEELRSFKAGIESAEKEQKLAQYSAILSKEEYESLKNNLDKFSIEEVEKEIGFILLKKNHFSAKEDNEPIRVNATPSGEKNPYGDLAVYFHK